MNKSELVSAIAKEAKLYDRNSESIIPPDVSELDCCWYDELALVKVKVGKKYFKAMLPVTILSEGIGFYELYKKLLEEK